LRIKLLNKGKEGEKMTHGYGGVGYGGYRTLLLFILLVIIFFWFIGATWW